MHPLELWDGVTPKCVPGLTWDELQEQSRKCKTAQWVLDVILSGHDQPFQNYYYNERCMVKGEAKIYPFRKDVIGEIVRQRKKDFYKEYEHIPVNNNL